MCLLVLLFFFFFLMIRPPPRSTLFPDPTLFRSGVSGGEGGPGGTHGSCPGGWGGLGWGGSACQGGVWGGLEGLSPWPGGSPCRSRQPAGGSTLPRQRCSPAGRLAGWQLLPPWPGERLDLRREPITSLPTRHHSQGVTRRALITQSPAQSDPPVRSLGEGRLLVKGM